MNGHYRKKGEVMSLLTLVCTDVDKWIVVEDEGWVEQMRGIPLRPASSRTGTIVFGPGKCREAELFIANRNRTTAPEKATPHKWVNRQLGGSPVNAESYEWVRYCSVCGMEDPCEDGPIPPCSGPPAESAAVPAKPPIPRDYEATYEILERAFKANKPRAHVDPGFVMHLIERIAQLEAEVERLKGQLQEAHQLLNKGEILKTYNYLTHALATKEAEITKSNTEEQE